MAEQPNRLAASRPSHQPGSNGAEVTATPDFAEERHFLDYLRVLSKRRWTAIPTFLIVVTVLLIPTFTAVPLYEASAQLLIEADTQNVVTFKAVVEQDAATTEFYQTQYKILESRAMARATLDALQLWNHPEFGGAKPGTPSAPQSGIRQVLGTALSTVNGGLTRLMGGIEPEKPSAAAADTSTSTTLESAAEESAAQSRTVGAFLARLTIAPVRTSRLVDVKFRATEPKLAADVANALSAVYIRQTQELKFLASKEATDWLGIQLSEQRRNVEGSELALQKYREQNDAISTEDPQVTQKLAELNTAVTRAKTDRIYKETVYNQLQAIKNNPPALATFPPVLSNPFIQQLKGDLSALQRQEAELSGKFGPLYPQLIEVRNAVKAAQAKIDREIANVVQAIQTEYATAKNQEDQLTVALEAQKGEALALNRKSIGYRALERDAASNRQIFESLLQRTKETTISGELKTNSIRISDAADIPRSPVWPRKQRNFLLSVCAGALLGVVLAFFIEYMDNKIRTPDDIRWDLGVACLGMVPKIGYKAPTGGSPLLNNGVPANFSEAFRSLRTNVLFSIDEGVNALVVTSTAPGEGKTLIASNLALGLALAGQRVLIVDGDMRRPRVHSVFGTPQEPGLSDLMVGQAKTVDVVRKSDIPNLWILAAGRLPPNPAELLSSKRFQQFLAAVRERFDWVVIDSPPVMAVTDASILAHSASGVLFVTAADVTNRPAAVRAMEQLAAAKASVIGAVLNRADVERNAYFYSPYYRNEYTAYYSGSGSSSLPAALAPSGWSPSTEHPDHRSDAL
jgi:capsular exopolysaccharide synthesis family protein